MKKYVLPATILISIIAFGIVINAAPIVSNVYHWPHCWQNLKLQLAHRNL